MTSTTPPRTPPVPAPADAPPGRGAPGPGERRRGLSLAPGPGPQSTGTRAPREAGPPGEVHAAPDPDPGTDPGAGLAASAELVTDPDAGDRGKPRIKIGGNPDAIRKLKAALRAGVIPDLYVTRGELVAIERVSGATAVDLDADVPLPVQSTPVAPALLAALLAEHTFTYRIEAGKDGTVRQVETTPPASPVLSGVLAGAEWANTPTLAGIIGTPVLRRDFTLLQHPGYDPASGLYLAPTVDLPPVPDRPSTTQVAKARDFVLRALLGDFEWEDHASLANYVALMVTPYLRRPLKALAPLAIISATAPGSGKSLLSGVIGLLVGQQTVPWPDGDDAELKKLITSTFTADIGAVIFDNLDEGTQVASPVLANLLTNPVWSDRILGSTAMGSWPNDRLWMVTGNNLRVGGDIASRSVYVRLKPAGPHPEERTGFVLGDLEDWIKDPAHRAELLWRLLVLVADWVAAGTPRDPAVPTMRQFTPWAHGVGGFLTHHGITGFLANLGALRRMDDEDTKWAIFLARWLDRLGDAPVKVADVIANATITRDLLTGHDLDPWEGEFITDRQGRRPRTPQKLAQLLTGQVDRYHGDPPLRLRRVQDRHNHSALYRVQEYQP
jgi:hypothetical protein